MLIDLKLKYNIHTALPEYIGPGDAAQVDDEICQLNRGINNLREFLRSELYVQDTEASNEIWRQGMM